MFQVGDYVIHGSNGACKVEKIGPLTGMSGSGDREYYTLTTCYTKSTIYSPVDNPKVMIRPVLTRSEAEKLISGINKIKSLGEMEDKRREQEYRDAIRSGRCEDLVRIIKTIDERRAKRQAQGKKTTSSDEKYFKMAEDGLLGELAISLDMSRTEAREYVLKQVQDKA
ncbi:MAG: CarD family transcriptional regulator [Lachnospiraceae bacterium]|nr:CarD family transcriptional regulator [Lachnospiraceae bacterium]